MKIAHVSQALATTTSHLIPKEKPMSYKHNAPFRYDVVGSFLRPDVLKQARADHAAGIIDDAALTVVENEAIRDLVAKQKAAGLHVITDGEFRRSYWHLDFMWGLNGIERRTSRTCLLYTSRAHETA